MWEAGQEAAIRMQLSGAYNVQVKEPSRTLPPTPEQQLKARNVSLELRGPPESRVTGLS